MTANAMKGDRDACLAAGMDGYIAKPVRAKELYEVIEQASLSPPVAVETSHSGDAPAVQPALDREKALVFAGDRATVLELASIFQEECPKQMQAVREAMSRSDAAGLQLAAHTLKGSAGVLAADPAEQAAGDLEHLARSGDLTQAPEAMQRLEKELARLMPALVALKQET
jgi:HPt (histidine-containing phosphotransfer) domain-containing protein